MSASTVSRKIREEGSATSGVRVSVCARECVCARVSVCAPARACVRAHVCECVGRLMVVVVMEGGCECTHTLVAHCLVFRL